MRASSLLLALLLSPAAGWAQSISASSESAATARVSPAIETASRSTDPSTPASAAPVAPAIPAAAATLLPPADPVNAPTATDLADQPVAAAASPSQSNKIGRVHDNIRRAQRRHALHESRPTLYGDYSRFKTQLGKDLGLSWSVDVSYLPQWGWTDGGSPSTQFLATPSIDWKVVQGKRFGEGSLQIAYFPIRYPSVQDGAQVSGNLGLITAINDFPTYQNLFAQLTYTQAFPGDKILIMVGQYPMFNFDGNQYLFNQQVNFNSYIFAQNGSSTYPSAGLGAYGQFNLSPTIQLAAGLQNASDPTGATLTTRDFGQGGYAWFAYGQWTPQFKGLGTAQYSFLYYSVPTVSSQSTSHGWSVNAVQNLNDTWAVFARANQAYDYLASIRSSFALGAAMNNPLRRSATDQSGLAVGLSTPAPAPTNPAGARNEKVLEAYWSWTFLGGLLLTPSVQYVFDPALAPARTHSWGLSLRATLML